MADLTHELITTGNDLSGYRVTKYLGVVRGMHRALSKPGGHARRRAADARRGQHHALHRALRGVAPGGVRPDVPARERARRERDHRHEVRHDRDHGRRRRGAWRTARPSLSSGRRRPRAVSLDPWTSTSPPNKKRSASSRTISPTKRSRPARASAIAPRRFPADVLKKMAPVGLLGGPVPEEYGGMGVDYISHALITEEVGRDRLIGPHDAQRADLARRADDPQMG